MLGAKDIWNFYKTINEARHIGKITILSYRKVCTGRGEKGKGYKLTWKQKK
jgi:hypothetical protein